MSEAVLLALISVVAGGLVTQIGNVLVARARAKPANGGGLSISKAIEQHAKSCTTTVALQDVRDSLAYVLRRLDEHIDLHLEGAKIVSTRRKVAGK